MLDATEAWVFVWPCRRTGNIHSRLDFAAFFEGVHGHEPFPWQRRLAQEVITSGWPDLLSLPTSSGKTAVIDIAVFHLASQSEAGPTRTAPLRVLFVIDRRIVVDEAHNRARRLAGALRQALQDSAGNPAVLEVAQRLGRFSGDAHTPLSVARLRGGMPRERDWAISPCQPLVAVSTVDQVGSRLLFRGYGVTPRMWPVHAGLVGSDALWLLDEVHLAQPLKETLTAVQRLQAKKSELAGPFGLVQLSATPSSEGTGENPSPHVFSLSPADHSHPVLGPRLDATKTVEIRGSKNNAAEDLAQAALRFVLQSQNLDGPYPRMPSRIAVICNQVALARRTFERLRELVGSLPPDAADAVLIIGPARPLDRQGLARQLLPLYAKPDRKPLSRPLVVVATQTIEAGADLDFDAMVTQVAPYDALKQRFGRLDRLGLRGHSPGLILIPDSKETWAPIERVYGAPAKRTADWLLSQGKTVDFGIMAAGSHTPPRECMSVSESAPTLLAPYLDLWAATSPAPDATPAPELFLHGPEVSADVQIVWRADIDLPRGPASERQEEVIWANASLGACPPSALEAIQVPVWVARAWLRTEPPTDFSDSPEKDATVDGSVQRSGRRFYRISREPDESRSQRMWVPESPSNLRAGDLIIVPAHYGGADHFGWDPDSQTEVLDLGAEANYRQREKVGLRLSLRLLRNASGLPPEEADRLWGQVVCALPEDSDWEDADAVLAALHESSADMPPSWGRLITGLFNESKRTKRLGLRVERRSTESAAAGFAVWTERRLPHLLDEGAGAGTETRIEMDAIGDENPGYDSVTGRVDSWRSFREVSLADHHRHVAAHARQFGERVGLSAGLTALLELAGQLHDAGKADPRFQLDLHGRSQVARLDPELASAIPGQDALLAKSGARVRFAATPSHFRHEALSVALASKDTRVQSLNDDDRDLLLWLIGTHHGNGRPFFPPLTDRAPHTMSRFPQCDGVYLTARAGDAPLKLDQGWPERAERVGRRINPWSLARLEAIVRLADHAASDGEARGGGNDE